ncbi:MAG: hypothetical protein MAG715_00676 [Methanonatronarchaeales archaeon]|nr:hypothetical protein [Methanonatronarchaeales archaeon]
MVVLLQAFNSLAGLMRPRTDACGRGPFRGSVAREADRQYGGSRRRFLPNAFEGVPGRGGRTFTKFRPGSLRPRCGRLLLLRSAQGCTLEGPAAELRILRVRPLRDRVTLPRDVRQHYSTGQDGGRLQELPVEEEDRNAVPGGARNGLRREALRRSLPAAHLLCIRPSGVRELCAPGAPECTRPRDTPPRRAARHRRDRPEAWRTGQARRPSRGLPARNEVLKGLRRTRGGG